MPYQPWAGAADICALNSELLNTLREADWFGWLCYCGCSVKIIICAQMFMTAWVV